MTGRGAAPRRAPRPADRPLGRVKIRLASNDGVEVVEVEGPSDEAQALADSAIRLWHHLNDTTPRESST